MNQKSIGEQAAQWMGALQTGGAREHQAFAAWLRESPHHVREYLLMTALEKELGDIDLQSFDVGEILSIAAKNVVPLGMPPPRPSPVKRGREKERFRPPPPVAGGGLGWGRPGPRASLSSPLLFGYGPKSQEYATAVGEQRVFELADGSVVQLNPLSRVAVSLSANARDIRLLSGEALFKVKHEPRPFRVHSGNTLIEDIGTQFHVYRRSSGTVVSVIEGAVKVASVRLDAGQEARIAQDGKTMKRGKLDASQLNTWRQRHLTFSGDTLNDIAADFNRYNRKPQIRIEGQALGAKRYSGGFDADDPESLVEYLRQSDAIAVNRQGNELIIRSR